MLKVHIGVELETLVDFFYHRCVCLKEVVHVVTAIDLVGWVGKLLPAGLLHFVKLGAFFFHLTCDCTDEIIDAGFIPLGLEDNHPFVFAVHLRVSVVVL